MHSRTNKLTCFVIITLLIALCVPDMAAARAGGGRSMGSRGSRTYQSPPAYRAAPRQPAAPVRATQATPPASNNFAAQPSGGRSFLSGLAGGIVGVSIANWLFGSNSHAASPNAVGADGANIPGTDTQTNAPTGSSFGLLPLLLLLGGGYFLYRTFFRSPKNTAGDAAPSNNSFTSPFAPASAADEITISDHDHERFGEILLEIQKAWSNADTNILRRYTTPEMAQYFIQELSANASRGLANKVEQVALTRAEIVESFRDEKLEYASARLMWDSCDYMVDAEAQKTIISGDAENPTTSEEIWTFTRTTGGKWLLSAITQVS